MKINKLVKYSIIGVGMTFALSCTEPKIGFISDDISYAQNPFIVTQGKVAYSNSVSADGSTSPLRVKLLEIRNKATNAVATELMQEYQTAIFTSQISEKDTTLELVAARVKREPFPVFKINDIGGQLQFSPETQNVPLGDYTFDVEVSNDAGKKVIKDICTIRIVAGNVIPFVSGSAVGYKQEIDIDGKKVLNAYNYGIDIKVTREVSENNSVQFKFVDKNGEVIDAVKYGLVESVLNTEQDYKFSSATPWLKGKPEKITTDAVVYSFPVVPFPYTWTKTGKAFCYMYSPKGTAATEFKTKTGFDFFITRINTSGFKFTYDGTYTITIKCDFIDI